MSAVDTQYYQNKKKTSFWVAVGFLILVIVATGALYGYNMKLQKDNETLSGEIRELQGAVDNIQSNDGVQVYSIYESHKSYLDKLEYESKIPEFVTHLKKSFLRYRVQASGFSYNDATVVTDISTSSGGSLPAYSQMANFIRSYREDEEALFNLLPLESFNGYDSISSQAQFLLK